MRPWRHPCFQLLYANTPGTGPQPQNWYFHRPSPPFKEIDVGKKLTPMWPFTAPCIISLNFCNTTLITFNILDMRYWKMKQSYHACTTCIWWRHQMETFSALLPICAGNSPVTGELTIQRPVTRSFDVSIVLCLNKRLSKQSQGWWFEAPSRSL